MIVWRKEKLICDLNWGFCAYYDLATDPGEKHNLADERPERAAALRRHARRLARRPRAAGAAAGARRVEPEGGPVPRAIERGRLGDLLAAPELGALMMSARAAARPGARRRSCCWRCRRARRRRRSSRRPAATATRPSPTGRPSARSAWATPARATRVHAVVDRPVGAAPAAHPRGAGAGADRRRHRRAGDERRARSLRRRAAAAG